jgi:hypothetical protein
MLWILAGYPLWLGYLIGALVLWILADADKRGP